MAMKAGIEAAQGRYIFNLDADDLFLPGKINKMVEVFVRDGSITHVAHPVIYRYEASGRKTTERIPRVILDKRITGRKLLLDFYRRNKFYGLGSSFAARADILKKTPIQNRDIGYNVDLYLALYSLNAGNAFIIKEPLSIYRIHSGNYSVEDKGKRAIMDSLANVALKGAITALEFEDEVVFLQGIRAQSASLGADGLKGKRTLRQAAQAAKNCFNYYGISAKGLNVLCNYGIFKYMLKARII
jgi:glycosyltransferase involved in cell wall biosynthesis